MAQIREIKNKKGISYKVIIRIKGYKPEYATFDKKTEAKNWASDVESQMRKGVWKQMQIKSTLNDIETISDLIDYFKTNEAPKRYKHPDQYNIMYSWWENKIGHLLLKNLDSSILTHCKNELAAEKPNKPYKNHSQKSNSTVRKYMFALSAVLRYGTRNLKILDRNPMADVDKPKKIKGVVRFLSETEKENLLTECKNYSESLYMFVLLALFSGGRYTELLTLKVENIDVTNSMIHFLDTKNKESRGVPIYYKLMNLLFEYVNENDISAGYVFVNKKQKLPYFKGMFEKVVKNCSIKNFRFHDCRHTYASWLAENGATLLEIAELLGHKNLNQVQIYAHLTKKTTAKLVRKMSANKFEF